MVPPIDLFDTTHGVCAPAHGQWLAKLGCPAGPQFRLVARILAPATRRRRAPPRSAPFNGGGGYHK